MADYVINEVKLNEFALYFREHRFPHIAKRGGAIISTISERTLSAELTKERERIYNRLKLLIYDRAYEHPQGKRIVSVVNWSDIECLFDELRSEL
jgi:hypothetical protein